MCTQQAPIAPRSAVYFFCICVCFLPLAAACCHHGRFCSNRRRSRQASAPWQQKRASPQQQRIDYSLGYIGEGLSGFLFAFAASKLAATNSSEHDDKPPRQVKFYDGPAQDWCKMAARVQAAPKKRLPKASASRSLPPRSRPHRLPRTASQARDTSRLRRSGTAVSALPKRSDNKEPGSGLPGRGASQGSRQETCIDRYKNLYFGGSSWELTP